MRNVAFALSSMDIPVTWILWLVHLFENVVGNIKAEIDCL